MQQLDLAISICLVENGLLNVIQKVHTKGDILVILI